jgi:hypothetical protein
LTIWYLKSQFVDALPTSEAFGELVHFSDFPGMAEGAAEAALVAALIPGHHWN